MMSNHLYRKFMELANRWPNEPLKKSNRNTVLFIRSEIEKYFRNEMNSNSNSVLCEKRLKSMNFYLKKKNNLFLKYFFKNKIRAIN